METEGGKRFYESGEKWKLPLDEVVAQGSMLVVVITT
jgi:hypothetical protein